MKLLLWIEIISIRNKNFEETLHKFYLSSIFQIFCHYDSQLTFELNWIPRRSNFRILKSSDLYIVKIIEVWRP